MTRAGQRRVQECLAALGEIDLSGAVGLGEEFKIIKRAYHKRILQVHPDKGGDAETFREVQASFEVLRDLYDAADIKSFGQPAAQTRAATGYAAKYEDVKKNPVPSYAYYAEAAEETVPTYRAEAARSKRSGCTAKGKAKKCEKKKTSIDKGELRVGVIDAQGGNYGRWKHLCCWRVPSKVWLGLPDPRAANRTPEDFKAALLRMDQVFLDGLTSLSPEHMALLVRHCMDEDNWAALRSRRREAGEPVVDDMKPAAPAILILALTPILSLGLALNLTLTVNLTVNLNLL